jgi:hypothetical protein
MESGREDAGSSVATIYVNADKYSGEYGESHLTSYNPTNADERVNDFGHGGSDYYTMNYFIQKILGDIDADTIDVYEALNMFLPGLFAYRSVLNGGIPMEIPDLRNPAVRDLYRNDTTCTDPKVAGNMLIPSFSKGNPEIPAVVYQQMREKFERDLTSDSGYAHAALTQGSHKESAGK